MILLRQDHESCNAIRASARQCEHCDKLMPQRQRGFAGRTKRFCSAACRVASSRENALRNAAGYNHPSRYEIDARSSTKSESCEAKNGHPNPSGLVVPIDLLGGSQRGSLDRETWQKILWREVVCAMTSPRTRRSKRTQRSVSPFAMLHWYVLDSQGWHDLTLMARCSYLELSRRYDGANNGTIGMSARDLASRLNRSPSHAAKSLRELEDAGFITITKQGTFKRKNRLASEYRLNAFISDLDSDPPDRRWNNSR